MQTNIQAVKIVDDANTAQVQALAGTTADDMATLLKGSNTGYEMGAALINLPIETVAEQIGTLGAPKQ